MVWDYLYVLIPDTQKFSIVRKILAKLNTRPSQSSKFLDAIDSAGSESRRPMDSEYDQLIIQRICLSGHMLL